MDDRTIDSTTSGWTASANDRLRQGWNNRLWGSMIVAVLIHVAVVLAWPTMTAAEVSTSVAVLEHVPLPEVDMPPPPENIARPAAPIAATSEVSTDVTIERLDWDAPTVVPPPPPASTEAAAASVGFTPFTVAPTIINRDEVSRVLDREYPQMLKNAGMGGTVRIAFHIDEQGRVLETRIEESSGHQGLDAAAAKVADVMRFTPALNREHAVAVWVTFPVVFRVR